MVLEGGQQQVDAQRRGLGMWAEQAFGGGIALAARRIHGRHRRQGVHQGVMRVGGCARWECVQQTERQSHQRRHNQVPSDGGAGHHFQERVLPRLPTTGSCALLHSQAGKPGAGAVSAAAISAAPTAAMGKGPEHRLMQRRQRRLFQRVRRPRQGKEHGAPEGARHGALAA